MQVQESSCRVPRGGRPRAASRRDEKVEDEYDDD